MSLATVPRMLDLGMCETSCTSQYRTYLFQRRVAGQSGSAAVSVPVFVCVSVLLQKRRLRAKVERG